MEVQRNIAVMEKLRSMAWAPRNPKPIDAGDDWDFDYSPPSPIYWPTDENWDSEDEANKPIIALVEDLAEKLTKTIKTKKLVDRRARGSYLERSIDAGMSNRRVDVDDTAAARKTWIRPRTRKSRNTPY